MEEVKPEAFPFWVVVLHCSGAILDCRGYRTDEDASFRVYRLRELWGVGRGHPHDQARDGWAIRLVEAQSKGEAIIACAQDVSFSAGA
jgi:hypothetical protein